MSNSKPGDQQNFDDGELEHEWAGGTIDLAVERQTTALRDDPRQRKFLIGGVAGCALLMVVLVGAGFAVRGGSEVVEDATPDPVEAPSAEVAVEAPVEPAAKPTLVAAKQPRRKHAGASTPGPTKPAAAKASQSSSTSSATATEPAAESAAGVDELPDVEQWDAADDEALRDQIANPAPE
ncbi:hypothetical protein [Enhygromyxa salina]|uniref:Uncharacterized protein n=1 Tax=Enhygromyxa salina TaxID=215803 RepID=A0A2S9XUD0_9BACT|nr:hypothetical protein [Enhygromyxa salina]PRP96444.1 hypothetical protein ENSA7_72590 [Enhygromyxa salina]